MKKFTDKERTFFYDVTRTDKAQYLLSVKDGAVHVTAPSYASDAEIEQVVYRNSVYLYYKVYPEKVNKTVHFGGIPYHAKCIQGEDYSVRIEGNEMIITAPEDEKRHYATAFRRFCKNAVGAEISHLIYDAQYDFREIDFPEIKVAYISGHLGFYRKEKNEIRLSPRLAKYDPIYTKLLLYHELTHALETEHNQRFFEILESKLPGSAELERKQRYIILYNDYL